MAIDDNTSYELTGAQVKDLANKIKAKADDNIFVGATSAIPGSKGLVPAPQAGDDTKFLSGDGTWEDVPAGTTYTAGNGIVIDQNDEISIDTSVVAEVSDLPTKTSDLQNDGSDGTSTYVEADDLATVATSGDYTDLINTPTIPTVNNSTITIQKNSTTVDSFTTNAASNKTINITVPTTAADVSALPDSTKYGASLSLTINSSTYVVTGQLKDQDGNNLGSAQTIDLPLESVVVSGAYDSQTKEVVLTLQGGSTIRFSVADLVSGLQSEITSQSPLDADLVDDSTSTNKFVTASDITTWNGKQNALTAGSNITISGNTISATDTTYSNYTGATSLADGTAGLVPAPLAGDETKFLSGNGQWTTVSQYNLPIASANDLGGIKVGTNLSIDSGTGVLSATDTTYSAFTGATTQQAGAAGLVPAPTTSDPEKYLKGDGTWGTPASGSAVTLFMYDSMGDLYDASSNYATAQDVLTALGNGKVIIGDIIDYPDSAYEIVSSDSDSYFVAVSRHANGSPEFVTLHYDSTSPAAPMGAWTRTAYIPQQKLTAGTNVSISGTTISATDTTYSNFTGATSSVAGANGLVPAPAAGDEGKALHGDGTWKDTTAKLVEMSYGEVNSWAKFIAAYNAGSIVYCRASSNANPATGSQTRKAFMAYVNNATSPTSVEFQYVRSASSKSDSQQCDQVFVYKLTNSNGGTWTVETRDMATKINVDSTLNKTYSSGANASMTLGAKTMTGATSSTAGTAGIVPAPATGDRDKFLKGDGTWATVSGGSPVTFYSTDFTSTALYADSEKTTVIKGQDLYDAWQSSPVWISFSTNGARFLVTAVHLTISSGNVTGVKVAGISTAISDIDDVTIDYNTLNATTCTIATKRISESVTIYSNSSGTTLYYDSNRTNAITGGTFMSMLFSGKNIYIRGVANSGGFNQVETVSGFSYGTGFGYLCTLRTSVMSIDSNGNITGLKDRKRTYSSSSNTSCTVTDVDSQNYSTSEVNTGGTWIDGKTIYKKTVDFGALPNATTKTVAHGISNLYRVIKYECLAYNSGSNSNTPLPLVSVVGNNSTMDINATDIVMNTAVDRSAFDECYITLYYTKSS